MERSEEDLEDHSDRILVPASRDTDSVAYIWRFVKRFSPRSEKLVFTQYFRLLAGFTSDRSVMILATGGIMPQIVLAVKRFFGVFRKFSVLENFYSIMLLVRERLFLLKAGR